jgi:flavin reductase (DIM6/NTAB) family NADH-FMN oxidoreductase RutF
LKIEQPRKLWDRLFAPSSSLAIITTVDGRGNANAATYGTCTRVNHEPVCVAFTANVGTDTANNVLATGEFVANLPSFDRALLEKVRIVGLPFAPGVSEIDKAGLTSLSSVVVKAPRIAECPRHFECKVEWTKQWDRRLMVVGTLVSASVDADCVDAQGNILWNVVKPVHYCGAPYGGMFVAMSDTLSVDLPYDGPEVSEFHKREKAILTLK